MNPKVPLLCPLMEECSDLKLSWNRFETMLWYLIPCCIVSFNIPCIEVGWHVFVLFPYLDAWPIAAGRAVR